MELCNIKRSHSQQQPDPAAVAGAIAVAHLLVGGDLQQHNQTGHSQQQPDPAAVVAVAHLLAGELCKSTNRLTSYSSNLILLLLLLLLIC